MPRVQASQLQSNDVSDRQTIRHLRLSIGPPTSPYRVARWPQNRAPSSEWRVTVWTESTHTHAHTHDITYSLINNTFTRHEWRNQQTQVEQYNELEEKKIQKNKTGRLSCDVNIALKIVHSVSVVENTLQLVQDAQLS